MVGPSPREFLGKKTEKNNKEKQTESLWNCQLTSEESGQSSCYRSASYDWIIAVIKNDLKDKVEVPNLLRRCGTTRNGYDPPSETRKKQADDFGLKELAAGRDEVKTWVEHQQRKFKDRQKLRP